MEKHVAASHKGSMYLATDLVIVPLAAPTICVHTKMCTPVFIAAVFTITKKTENNLNIHLQVNG